MITQHDILSGADRCVKCGLCSPHCPTYGLSRDEAESPRGRISLMQGLASGRLAPGARLLAHLDSCLGCRACERICPSGVAYGELLDATRAAVEPRRRTWRARLQRGIGLGLVAHKPLLRGLAAALRGYRRSGLQALARRSGLLRALGVARTEARLPPLSAGLGRHTRFPASGAERGRVALFTGCLGEALDGATLRASVRLLTRLGYAVDVPRAQACCGALHQHNGAPDGALALARRNLAAFAGADAIVFAASGCGAQLSEYARLPWPDDASRAQAADLAGRAREIGAFLDDCDWTGLRLHALHATAAVHEPCTQRNVLRRPDTAYRLLRRIPGLSAIPLAGNDRCCGAAGSHVLTHPDMADALRAPKLEALAADPPQLLASTNFGCAMHLADGLRRRGLPVEVVHPVVLLARQLQD